MTAADGAGAVGRAVEPDVPAEQPADGRDRALDHEPARASGPPPGPSPRPGSGFDVHLDVFDGPFDLLLSLIAKHKLDVTEIALSKVTDDFIAHIRRTGAEWDLGQATEFLVVAATLLDLKAARLLPAAEVEDEEDLALLEARDLLFARLLQYRAYKQVAAFFAGRMAEEAKRYPRAVGLEPRFASLLPEVLLGLGATEFAALAARALAPRVAPVLSIEHLHAARVSVREQAALMVPRLRRAGQATFRSLVADCPDTLHVVARFLALLELYREQAVTFDQLSPLGELTVRWIGAEAGVVEVTDEFDDSQPDGSSQPAEPEQPDYPSVPVSPRAEGSVGPTPPDGPNRGPAGAPTAHEGDR